MNSKIIPTNQTTFSLSNINEESKSINKVKLTSLVRDPIQNRNTYFLIKDSSISSLIEYTEQVNNSAKEKKKVKYLSLIKHSLNSTNSLVKYLQSPVSTFKNNNSNSLIGKKESLDLVGKKNKIQTIKEQNLSNMSTTKFQSQPFIDFISAVNEWKNWKKQTEVTNITRAQVPSLVVNPSHSQSGSGEGEKNKLFITNMSLINSINPFNSKLAQSNNIMYYFNKKNTYNLFKNGKNIGVILVAAFSAMENTLISKAYLYGKPNSILINLFFFWKFDALDYLSNKLKQLEEKRKEKEKMYRINSFKKNSNINKIPFRKLKRILKVLKRKYNHSRKWSKFAINFNNHMFYLTRVLTILLNKQVNFQFTRIYYPYNESRIMAEFMGFLSFFFKFNLIILQLYRKIIFKIRNKRYLRLKYMQVPSVITGMNVKLAGRVSKVRSNNRTRTKKWQLGNLTRSVNTLKVNNRFTNKSINGVFSINVNSNAIIIK
jgi:hypothetical protein